MPALTEEERQAEYLRQQKEQLARSAAQLASMLSRPAKRERVYESIGSPRVLLRIFEATEQFPYFCVVECEGLAPYRNTTAEERQLQILSLDPPAVAARTPQRLVDVASRALQTAIVATPLNTNEKGVPAFDESIGAGDLAMIHYRTARAVRQALRLLGEDI